MALNEPLSEQYWPETFWADGYWPQLGPEASAVLLEAGYWPTTYWASGYWQTDNQYWHVYGIPVAPPIVGPGKKKKFKPEPALSIPKPTQNAERLAQHYERQEIARREFERKALEQKHEFDAEKEVPRATERDVVRTEDIVKQKRIEETPVAAERQSRFSQYQKSQRKADEAVQSRIASAEKKSLLEIAKRNVTESLNAEKKRAKEAAKAAQKRAENPPANLVNLEAGRMVRQANLERQQQIQARRVESLKKARKAKKKKKKKK